MPPLPASRRREARQLLADGLSPKQVAARLGVGLTTIYRWRDQPASADTTEGAALRAAYPGVLMKLISLAQGGDIRAIKEVLSRAGEVVPDPTPEEHDSEQQIEIMMRVIEYELDRISPLLASNMVAVWLRIDQHLAKVVAGELPVPPPVSSAHFSPDSSPPPLSSPIPEARGDGDENPQEPPQLV